MSSLVNLKVLWFNWRSWVDPDAGGAEVTLHEVATRLVERGCEVHLVTRNPGNLPKNQTIEGVKITRKGGKFLVYPLAAKWYLTEPREQYDVVLDEVNTVPFFTPLYVREPVVALMHQVLVKDILIRELPSILSHTLSILEPNFIKLYRNSRVISVSKRTMQDLVSIGIPPSHITVIHNGVDQTKYVPGDHDEVEPFILYVGRLMEYKNIDHLIVAMKRVVTEAPEGKLFIVGDGNPSYRLKLLTLIKRLGLEDKVRLCGYVSEAEKVCLMQKATCLAYPSIREGFGLSIIEANACGTPAIGYAVPGIREAIIDGITGMLAPKGDVKVLSELMLRFLNDTELRNKCASNALEYAKQFRWENTTNLFLSVLQDSAASKGR